MVWGAATAAGRRGGWSPPRPTEVTFDQTAATAAPGSTPPPPWCRRLPPPRAAASNRTGQPRGRSRRAAPSDRGAARRRTRCTSERRSMDRRPTRSCPPARRTFRRTPSIRRAVALRRRAALTPSSERFDLVAAAERIPQRVAQLRRGARQQRERAQRDAQRRHRPPAAQPALDAFLQPADFRASRRRASGARLDERRLAAWLALRVIACALRRRPLTSSCAPHNKTPRAPPSPTYAPL